MILRCTIRAYWLSAPAVRKRRSLTDRTRPSSLSPGLSPARWISQQHHRAAARLLRAKPPLGVVHSDECGFFTSLERVTPDARTIGRRIWIALAALAAVGVVIVSWRVPEPEVNGDPNRRVENVSYMQYTPQQAPPPAQGPTRRQLRTRSDQ